MCGRIAKTNMIPKLVINKDSRLKKEPQEDKLRDMANEILQDLDSIKQKVQEFQKLIDDNN